MGKGNVHYWEEGVFMQRKNRKRNNPNRLCPILPPAEQCPTRESLPACFALEARRRMNNERESPLEMLWRRRRRGVGSGAEHRSTKQSLASQFRPTPACHTWSQASTMLVRNPNSLLHLGSMCCWEWWWVSDIFSSCAWVLCRLNL